MNLKRLNLFNVKEEAPVVVDKKKSNYYFTKETQKYIVAFQNAKTDREKNRLYESHIHPAFTELVTNLITVYNYKSFGEEMSHFKSDCVSFLFETIYKWDESKGTKAFSYFNVVAKNWLTIQSRRLYKNYKRNCDIQNNEELTKEERAFLANHEFHDDQEDIIDDRPEMLIGMFFAIDLIEDEITSAKDKLCLEAIRHLYNNIEKIQFFNKRAIFVYLREISGLNSTELSCSLSRIRKVYRKYVGKDKEIDFDDYKRSK